MDMKYKLRFAKEAENDLNSIYEYIHLTLEAPHAAANLMASIERKIKVLAELPFSFPAFQESPMAEMSYRKLIVDKYVVIYFVDEPKKVVNIVRVFSGMQDYIRFFE